MPKKTSQQQSAAPPIDAAPITALSRHHGAAAGYFWIGHAIGVNVNSEAPEDDSQCLIIAATPAAAAKFARQLAVMPIDPLHAQRVAVFLADSARPANALVLPEAPEFITAADVLPGRQR